MARRKHGPATVTRRPEKVDALVTASVFRIATGDWRPGTTLPPVREAAIEWKVSLVTAFRVYRQLEAAGLVRSEPRRGVTVCDRAPAGGAFTELGDIQKLYTLVRRKIDQLPGLSARQVFAHMAALAAAEAAQHPEVFFVECTSFQAQQHAREVERRLNVPCGAVTTAALKAGAPRSARVLLTTAFHYAELERFSSPPGRRVVPVTLEPSDAFARDIAHRARSVRIMSLQPAQGRMVARHLERVWSGDGPAISVTRATPATVNDLLARYLGRASRPARARVCVLSLTNWENASAGWRASGAVFPVTYTIAPSAWPAVTRAIGLAYCPAAPRGRAGAA